MKVKQSPDDFRVEELTDRIPGEQGSYAFYRLEKRDWTTLDALATLRQRWRLEPRRLSHGGLKDRHAATIQYLTIFHGPRRNLSQQGLSLTYLGQLGEAYSSKDIRANRFEVVLRNLMEDEASRALAALDEVRSDGVPNYFDDQRFGSVAEDGEFIARLMVLGRFEDALKLALTGEYEFDRPAERREKKILRQHWGDWPTCKQKLPRGHALDLVDYLSRRPTDFRGSLERLRPELRGLYLSAYQSDVWNRTLALYLRLLYTDRLLTIKLRGGERPFPRGLTKDERFMLESSMIPLPSARAKLGPEDPFTGLIGKVLAEDGLTLEQMKVKGSRELFFSRGERAALFVPHDLQGGADDDERHAGRRKLNLRFELPRGCYATLIVKRLQAS